MNTNSFYLFDFSRKNDARGKMCIGESDKEIPFVVRRVFYQFGFSDGSSRGQHANLKSSFVFVCLVGKCTIKVDDGIIKKEFLLSDPSKGLFVRNKTWKEMTNFSSDCVLLVLSDCYYDKDEYIRDYEKFKEMCTKH